MTPSLQGAVHLQEKGILLQELLSIIFACAVWGLFGGGAQ